MPWKSGLHSGIKDPENREAADIDLSWCMFSDANRFSPSSSRNATWKCSRRSGKHFNILPLSDYLKGMERKEFNLV